MGTMGGQPLSSFMPAMQQAGQNAIAASNITMASSLSQSQLQLRGVADQANGVEAQMQLQTLFDKINTEVDNSMTVAKNVQALASKSLEMYTLVAQTREKIMGAFNTINQQRANNSWANIKTLSQGFKF